MGAISQRLRFEILRRDGFACQYCGATAPAATLVVDHVVPVALGGTDAANNLISACEPCNIGKASTLPSEDEVAKAQERDGRWREAQRQVMNEVAAQRALTHWFQQEWAAVVGEPLVGGWAASVRRFQDQGLVESDLIEAMQIAAERRKDFSYFCGICWNWLRTRDELAHELMGSFADEMRADDRQAWKMDDAECYPAWLDD
jgi:hypothetical protein